LAETFILPDRISAKILPGQKFQEGLGWNTIFLLCIPVALVIERSFNKNVKPNLIIQWYDSFIQWFIAFVMRFCTKEILYGSKGFLAA